VASPHVNYERAAPEYARRRTPTDERLEVWGEAVADFVSGAELAVDLAAGTGGFSAALRNWGASRVVAIEPSAAMQGQARSAGVPMIRSRAESIPLRADVADVIWISTAFHHFADPAAAAADCRRVLRTGGHLLIRGFVPDHTDMAWLDLFPGSAKATARFPSIDAMSSVLGQAGFSLVHETTVEEGTQSYADRADVSERMRHADSILTALDDDEVAAGIAALRSAADEVEHFALSLLVYRVERRVG
jgi:ubiquinone/menaquinone biosynthesis C-methylase UbiE